VPAAQPHAPGRLQQLARGAITDASHLMFVYRSCDADESVIL
jgi:hypothetical protein